MLIDTTKVVIIGLVALYCVYRMFKPVTARDGLKSRTLTGLYITMIMIFAVIMIDTLNDRGQVVVDDSSKASTKSTRRASSARRGRKSTVRDNSYARAVLKEKYAILAFVFAFFGILYLLGHQNERMTKMGVWFIMAARKLNPFENELDMAAISVLEEDPDNPDTRQWYIEYVLAKRGVSSTPAPPPTVDFPDDSQPIPPPATLGAS